MRALLSVVGTRGDVQPVIALALEVRALGHEVRLCVPPNFVEWARGLGFETMPVGVEMRAPRPGTAPTRPLPDLFRDQFDVLATAVDGCNVILGANAHQYAAPSIAELRRIPYVNALYAPTALPTADNTRVWNERSLEPVNGNRTRLGLPRIADVLSHVVTDHPWLATDPTLAPEPALPGLAITQTGAWIYADATPLDSRLAGFLDAGPAPVYFGFGSMPVAGAVSRTLVEAAQAAGRRAIISQGWANLDPIDDAPDCIVVEDVNHQALFPRIAAVVHHGGAGTTLAAARAGAPQVVVPMFGDQPFWAGRVRELGIGASLPLDALTSRRLASALRDVGDPAVVARATSIAGRIATDGAERAARRLVEHVSQQGRHHQGSP